MKSIQTLLLTSVLVFGLLHVGCRKDDEGTTAPPTPAIFLGVAASATESGTLSLSIATAKANGTANVATGTLKLSTPSPATIALTGSFVNDTLRVSGGGYNFIGIDAGVRLKGTFLGPHGYGGFAAQVSINSVGTTYCGTYTTQTVGENGTFNLVVTGVSVAGVAVSATGQDLTQLDGSIIGNTITIPNVGAGAINGNTVTGSFTFGANRGVWSATVCQ